MLSPDCEKVIAFLRAEYNAGDKQSVTVSKAAVSKLDISETNLVKELLQLKQDGYIEIVDRSVHDSLSKSWRIKPYTKCLNYSQDKKAEHKSYRREKRSEIRAWLTFAVSIVALLVSVFSIYIQFFCADESAALCPGVSDTLLIPDKAAPEIIEQPEYISK